MSTTPDSTKADVKKRKWDEPADGASPASKAVKTEDEAKPAVDSKDAADAAAEIAARLAQQYAPKQASAQSSSGNYVQDGREAADPEHVKDIEINDLRNRYVLTKGATQQQIFADTGANVVTKGVWYPDKSMSTQKDPPLYLHITADTPEKLQKGIDAVQALIDQELGPLIDERRFRNRDEPRERRKWAEEKVFIDIEPLRNFNVRAKVVGPGGLFVKYIQQETQTRVQIKGMGSGFVETETGREGEDPIHIHVTGPDQVMVDKGAEMARDLLTVVREEHGKARAVLEQGFQQQQGGFYPGPGGPGGFNQQQQQGYQPQGYQGSYQQSPYGAGVTAPLPPGEAPPPPPPPSDAGPRPPSSAPPPAPGQSAVPPQQAGGTATPEQWAAYWNSLDPASQAYYMQYYAGGSAQYGGQQQQAQQGYGTPQQGYGTPQQQPPPPPSSAPPPPPPPPSGQQQGGKGTYGAVPPPPGL